MSLISDIHGPCCGELLFYIMNDDLYECALCKRRYTRIGQILKEYDNER